MAASTYAFLVSLLWGLSAAGLAWHMTILGGEITYITLADGRRKERSLPFMLRAFLPIASILAPKFRRPLFARSRESVSRNITAAGFEGLLLPEEVLALRPLLCAVGGVLWMLFVRISLSAANMPIVDKLSPLLLLLGPLWFFIYPTAWLKRAMRTRHNSIRRSLPFVLDILTLSVEAGVDFMTALQRHVGRAAVDELGEELLRVVREIQIGKTRREALRDMSTRVGLAEMRMVVNALVQADELGVSIGYVLRIQAEQIRQRRFERAEKLANEAPVKMLFPLLTFIFPAVFLVLLGPIIRRLLEQGF